MSHHVNAHQRAFEAKQYAVLRAIGDHGRLAPAVLAQRELLEKQMAISAVRQQFSQVPSGPGRFRRWLGARVVTSVPVWRARRQFRANRGPMPKIRSQPMAHCAKSARSSTRHATTALPNGRAVVCIIERPRQLARRSSVRGDFVGNGRPGQGRPASGEHVDRIRRIRRRGNNAHRLIRNIRRGNDAPIEPARS